MRTVLLIGLTGLMMWCAFMAIITSLRASDTEAIAHEAFDIINEQRIEFGVPALVWDEELERLAIAHSKYSKKPYFDFTGRTDAQESQKQKSR